jgi:hypothetical protein
VSWRQLNRAVHRDVGYLCAGLTVVYALTGVLLNHLHDWNPHWKREPVAARVAAALALLALTGLFVLKGKDGITRRGAVLTTAGRGLPVPLLLLVR